MTHRNAKAPLIFFLLFLLSVLLATVAAAAEAPPPIDAGDTAAGLTRALVERIVNERPTMFGLITRAVARLAAVTPAAGFVRLLGAIWIGIGATFVCCAPVVVLKAKPGCDDTLGAFGVHAVDGVWGTVAAGLFSRPRP